MPESSRLQGARGETLAANFLIKKGHTLVQQNYRDRASRGEIDLITRHQNCLVFVEVKAGHHHKFGAPETWVDVRKQRRIIRAATGYLQAHDLHEAACRFDVVGITYIQNKPHITHIENAFWHED